tara:strand:+ start:550 stop:744 length:195 start_codon:yes stop_codon:yes gene_type:complete
MLEANLTMNQNVSELKVLRRQVNLLKKLVENNNIEIKKLRQELADVKQDRSNIITSWAEVEDEK